MRLRTTDHANTTSELSRYRLAAVVVAVVAFFFILWVGRDQYFIFDEWAYWTTRKQLWDGGSYASYFMEPHVGHWHGLTMAVWRPIEWVFGLRTYLPYLVPTILVHCLAGILLFELLVHARVRFAVALATATLFLFMGNAAGNVAFAWQIAFTAPIALTFLTLWALQRFSDGGSAWWGAVVAGGPLIAITASGVGLTAAIVAALAAALRRRFLLAAAVVLTSGGAYLIWRQTFPSGSLGVDLSHAGSYLRYVAEGFEQTAADMFQTGIPALAWVLLAVAVIGTAVAAVDRDPYWSVYFACLVGAVFFYATLATQRAGVAQGDPGAFAATSSRYVYISSALLLPSLAYLADRLLSLRRWIAPVLAACLVWALVGNARFLVGWNDLHATLGQEVRASVAAAAAMGPHLDAAAPDLLAFGAASIPLDVETVQEFARNGMLPCDTSYEEAVELAAALQIPTPSPEDLSCDR